MLLRSTKLTMKSISMSTEMGIEKRSIQLLWIFLKKSAKNRHMMIK